MNKYNLQIVDRVLTAHQPSQEQKIVMHVTGRTGAFDLQIIITTTITTASDNQIKIDVIETSDIPYLKKLFSFGSYNDVKNNLDKLKIDLNNKPYQQIPQNEWDVFTMQFKDWFASFLYPLLSQEVMIHKLYFGCCHDNR